MVILSFMYASCKDPGIIKPDPSQTFLKLLRDINPADLCPECKVIRTARSRHCAICNQCVERFDHHCPWINNCVGIQNHNAFMMFLSCIWIKIVFHSYFDSASLYRFIVDQGDFECTGEQCVNYCIMNLCTIKSVHIISCVICIVICIFYFLLSSVLLYTHIKNYMANRTTNERFSRKKGGKNQVDKEQDEDASQEDAESQATSSIMSISDFKSSLVESGHSSNKNSFKSKRPRHARNKRKNCLINCWKMSTHTTIVP